MPGFVLLGRRNKGTKRRRCRNCSIFILCHKLSTTGRISFWFHFFFHWSRPVTGEFMASRKRSFHESHRSTLPTLHEVVAEEHCFSPTPFQRLFPSVGNIPTQPPPRFSLIVLVKGPNVRLSCWATLVSPPFSALT